MLQQLDLELVLLLEISVASPSSPWLWSPIVHVKRPNNKNRVLQRSGSMRLPVKSSGFYWLTGSKGTGTCTCSDTCVKALHFCLEVTTPSESQVNFNIVVTILLLKVNLNDICLLFHSKHIAQVTGKNNYFWEMILSQTLAVVTSEYILIEYVFLTLNDCFIALKYFPCE